jgi:hypothetical protein
MIVRRILLPRQRKTVELPMAPVVPTLEIVQREQDGLFQIGLADDAAGPFESRAMAQAVWWASNHSTATAAGESGQ